MKQQSQGVTFSLKPQWRIHYSTWKKASEKKKRFRAQIWYKLQAEVRWYKLDLLEPIASNKYFFLFLAQQLEMVLRTHTLPRAQASNKDASYNQLGPTHPIISQHMNSHHLPHQDEPPKSIAMDWEELKRQGVRVALKHSSLTALPSRLPRVLLWALLTGTNPVWPVSMSLPTNGSNLVP